MNQMFDSAFNEDQAPDFGGHFNPDMLQIARNAAGMSQTQLAKAIGVAQNTLSRWESGLRTPSEEEVNRLSIEFGRPLEFFYRVERPFAVDSAVLFHRKRARTPLSALRPLHARINVARLALAMLLEQIEDWDVHLVRMPIDEHESAAMVARKVRASWQVAPGPIRDLVGLVEAAGVVVFQFDFGSPDIDAIGVWPLDTPPLMFINSSAPADRVRFSLAHELGHLVMHDVPNGEMEKQADEFASEFLLPRDSALTELREISSSSVWRLKRRWRVSAQCIIRRAKDSRLITNERYTSLMCYFSKKGWRKCEPYPIEEENPTTVERLRDAFLGQLGYSEEAFRQLAGVTQKELVEVFKVLPRKPRLRVVGPGELRRAKPR